MRALCVARHRFLSEHLGRFFEALGLDTVACVGLREALDVVHAEDPDVVICDYDVLATTPLAAWEDDPRTAAVPVIAVSLTRHPGEAHLLDINGVAGFLYLPTLDAEDAHRLLGAVRRKRAGINPPNVLTWPGTTPVAQLR
jgi:CheY-like chemotaxis protein